MKGGEKEMNTTRQILVSVWQDKPLKVDDFLSLIDRFDFEIVVEVLKDLNEKAITVSEAEEELRKRRKGKCIH
ncbi:hypothetical protein KKB71_03270 [Patescibacteria group bacterium]|nr:hypothetical protein [Patescibacteria group bacterium]MBU2219015.1 hypothetical protein [Patescibacteria group bacterium]MBU2263287.1 hypothetical protein [Patescibacteria group bacterium]